MKKMLLILTAMMSICMIVVGQQTRTALEKRTFLAFSAGPAFPVGAFSSNDLADDQAGFAKTGFNLDLQAGYKLVNDFGIAGSAFYGREPLDEITVDGTNISVDHWQYYGLVVGPMISKSLSPRTIFDMQAMTGVVNTNSPKFSSNGELVATEDWAVAMPVKVGADVRFQFGKDGYFLTGVNFMYMEPRFKTTIDGETYTARQNISVLNLHAGIGLRF